MTLGAGRRYLLDQSVSRSADGRLLVGGTPPRLVRLTARGSGVLDAALAGRSLDDDASRRLVRRLDGQGLTHPGGEPLDGASPARMTTVVPLRNAVGCLPALIETLRARGRVIVVDDGSTGDSPAVARTAGAVVVRNAGPPGPAGARNTGLAVADTELVAFVDADCVVRPGWQDGLAPLFEDPDLALAAPRVASVRGSSPLARYERAYSPLDLGDRPGLVGPRRRLTYVPSAALVGRRSALLSVGGFDPGLEVGEDVDLVWRLVAAGWKVRYVPEAEVRHEPRRSVRALARQRYRYGSSAPQLERRHPGAAAPLRVAPHTLGIWAMAAAAGPTAATLAFAVSIVAATTAAEPAARLALARLIASGHAQATRHLARLVVREWLPLSAVACVGSRRARRLAGVAFLVDMAAARRDAWRLKDAPGQVALRAVDQLAYAAGLWSSMAGERSPAAIAVRVTRRRRRRWP